MSFSLVNFDNFKSGTETYTQQYSIYNNGSAITLGSEPYVSFTSSNFTSSWTMELMYKSSSLTKECLFSIGNGSGGRYIDVTREDGNKVVLYADGQSVSLTYTSTLPDTAWTHVAVTYNTSTNLMYISSKALRSSAITMVTDPVIASTEFIRFMRPIHTDDWFFSGYIDSFRISKILRSEYSSGTTYLTTYYSVTSVANWQSDTNTVAVGVDTRLKVTSTTVGSSAVTKRYHSLCRYTADRVLACTSTSSVVSVSTTDSTSTLMSSVVAKGMHYFQHISTLMYINSTTLERFVIKGTTASNTRQTVSSTGTYRTCRGDLGDRYLFGCKLSATGSINQIFRINADGTNEITVSVSSLLGSNVQVQGFAVDSENDRIFFHDVTTFTVRSVSFDLVSNYTTHALVVSTSDNGDIDYARGYLYYGNKIFGSTSTCNGIFRYNISTGKIERFLETAITTTGGLGQTPDIFVDPISNRLVISGASFLLVSGSAFDISLEKMVLTFRDATSANLKWTAVSSATSYKVYANGSLIGTTTNTYFKATGLTTGTFYRFTLEYTTNQTTYSVAQYYNAFFTPTTSFMYSFDTDPVPSFAKAGDWVNPYNPTEIVYLKTSTPYIYNLETGTDTMIANVTLGTRYDWLRRSYKNKNMYFALNTLSKIFNGGENLSFFAETTGYNGVVNSTERTITTLSSGTVYGIDISFDGSTIYYTTSTNQVRSVSTSGTNDVLVTTTTGAPGVLSADPLNSDTLVYIDDASLIHLNLSTSVKTTVRSALMASTSVLACLDGKIYGQRFIGPYFTVNIDGTNLSELGHPYPSNWTIGMYIDTINKRILLFDTDVSLRVIVDPTIPDLPNDPSSFVVTQRSICLDMEWESVSGATSYGVKYTVGAEGVSESFITSVSSTTRLKHSVQNLTPLSEYTLYLYYSTSTALPNILLGYITTSTLSNVGTSYDDSSFDDNDDGKFDLTGLTDTSLSLMIDLLNEIFSTGDYVTLKVAKKNTTTKFVNRGATATVDINSSMLIPFSTSSGSGQNVTLTLSNNTNVAVSYNETTEAITVGSTSYTQGKSFILDGKKVTVYDV